MPRGKALSPERKKLIEDCLADGWSWNQIKKTHGVAYNTMKRHFPGTGMDLSEAGRLGHDVRMATLAMRKVSLPPNPKPEAETPHVRIAPRQPFARGSS